MVGSDKALVGTSGEIRLVDKLLISRYADKPAYLQRVQSVRTQNDDPRQVWD
jgi:hypothetical protein